MLLDTQKHLESKRSWIDSLELQLNNITLDRDVVRKNNVMLMKQRNNYCNSAKRLYAKLIDLHLSSGKSKEQHRKLLPFLVFEREKIDTTS